ncbi:MAG: hypothetical protein AAF589_02355 [Planctomycetota bacterium]
MSEPWRPFATAMVKAWGLELLQESNEWVVRRPAEAAASTEAMEPESTSRWGGGLKTRLRRKKVAVADEPEFRDNSPAALFDWLATRAEGQDKLPCFTPVGEPHAVHEFAHPMLDAYTIDGGNVHIGGCHLEDVPLLRQSSLNPVGAAAPTVTHRFFDAKPTPIGAELVRQLHLGEVAPPAEPKPQYRYSNWSDAVATAGKAAATPPASHLVASIVLAKRVEGRLEVNIGEATLEIAFAGWTRTLKAPPAICPETGIETYHLAALADGRIVAAEAIGKCEISKERRLKRDLAVCGVTDQTVGEEHTMGCPVLRKPVLKDQFAECPTCGEQVARTTMLKETCLGCNDLPKAPRGDARLAALLEASHEASHYGSWRIAETESVTILLGRRFLRQLLVVVDRTSRKLIRAKTRRLLGRWKPLPVVDGRLHLADRETKEPRSSE